MAKQAIDLSGGKSTAASTREVPVIVTINNEAGRLVTHGNVDPDAALSIQVVKKNVPQYSDAEIKFVDANDNGSGLRGDDFAVDIYAGGKGHKGSHEESGVGSAFQHVLTHFASDNDQRIFDSLATVITVDDSYGNAVYHLTPDTIGTRAFQMLSQTSFCSTFGAYKKKLCDDLKVIHFTGMIYEGFLEIGRQKFGLESDSDSPIKTLNITLNAAACVWAHSKYSSPNKEWSFEERSGSQPFRSVMVKYAPAKDQEAMKSIIDFVEAYSLEGDALFSRKEYGLSEETAEQLAETSLAAIFNAIKTQSAHSLTLLHHAAVIFDGLLANGKTRLHALDLIKTPRVKYWYYGKIALVNNTGCPSLNAVLFERGVQAIVYINKCNIGIVRNSYFRGKAQFAANDPSIMEVIKAAGEAGLWFEHPTGFLLCWGSSKSVKTLYSKVKPMSLITALISLFKAKNLFIGEAKPNK